MDHTQETRLRGDPRPVGHTVLSIARATGGPFSRPASSRPRKIEVSASSGATRTGATGATAAAAGTPPPNAVRSARNAACALAVAIQRQIESVRVYEIAALEGISTLGSSCADSELIHDLVDYVRHITADKIAALEYEATAVDAALERLDAASDAMSRSAALAALEGLPSGPIELDIIAFEPGDFPPSRGSNRLGRILAPPRVSAGWIRATGVHGCVLVGRSAKFTLSLSEEYDCGSDMSGVVPRAVLFAFARHLAVDIVVSSSAHDGSQQGDDLHLPVGKSVWTKRREVIITFYVPEHVPCGSHVKLSVRVTGANVSGLPCQLTVAQALRAPAFRTFSEIDGSSRRVSSRLLGPPAVGLDGTLYMPGLATYTKGKEAPIAATSASGDLLRPLSVPGLEPPLCPHYITACAETGTLYVQDRYDLRGSYSSVHRLIAIHSTTGRLKWANEYRGETLSRIAVIPSAIFTLSRSTRTILALSPVDGTVMYASEPAGYPYSFSGKVVADPTSGVVIAEAVEGDEYGMDRCVYVFQWIDGALVEQRHAALGSTYRMNRCFQDDRRVTYVVVPRRPGEEKSHLVVACASSSAYGRWIEEDGDIVMYVRDGRAEAPDVGAAAEAPEVPRVASQAVAASLEQSASTATALSGSERAHPWGRHASHSAAAAWPVIGKEWPSLIEALASTRTTAVSAPLHARPVPVRDEPHVAQPQSECALDAGICLHEQVGDGHVRECGEATGADPTVLGPLTYDHIEDALLREADQSNASSTPRYRRSRVCSATGVSRTRCAAVHDLSVTPVKAGAAPVKRVVSREDSSKATGTSRFSHWQAVAARSSVAATASVNSRRGHHSCSKPARTAHGHGRMPWWRPEPSFLEDDEAEEEIEDRQWCEDDDGLAISDVTLNVFSLPDLVLVHRHVLQKVALRGLASDLAGSALLVSDSHSGGVHIVAWPLPGML